MLLDAVDALDGSICRTYPQAADVKKVKYSLEVKKLAAWQAVDRTLESGGTCA